MGGSYQDPIYAAQESMNPPSQGYDPNTGMPSDPAASQQSGDQGGGGGLLGSIMNAVNPVSSAQAKQPMPSTDPRDTSPGWFTTQPQFRPYTHSYDPSDQSATGATRATEATGGKAAPATPMPRPDPRGAPAVTGPSNFTPASIPPDLGEGNVNVPGGTSDPRVTIPTVAQPSSTDPVAPTSGGVDEPGPGSTAPLTTKAVQDRLGITDTKTDTGGKASSDITTSPWHRFHHGPWERMADQPSSEESPYGGGEQQGGQYGGLDPIKLITDFLTGGPQALMRDLLDLAQQGGGTGGGPALAPGYEGQNIPMPRVDPRTGTYFNPQTGQHSEFGPGHERPADDTVSPQSGKTSGETTATPTKVKTTKETEQVKGAIPGTKAVPDIPGEGVGTQPLDPFTSAAAGGTSQTALAQPGTAATGGSDASYISQFGGHSTTNMQSGPYGNYIMNPEFTRRLAAAGRAYQQETGRNPQYGEGDRDAATQAHYWRRLQGGRLGMVARPGHSLHQRGLAMDIPSGGFYRWLRQNGHRFGLGFPLRGDPQHIQMQHGRFFYPYTPPDAGKAA
jgi:hypothetical protein